jgi:hypothetical protein
MKTIKEHLLTSLCIPFVTLLLVTSHEVVAQQNVTLPISPGAPSSAVVQTGQSVAMILTNLPAFSSASTNSPPFQWFKNGFEIDGGTNSSYTIADITMDDVGTYSAIAAGQHGSVVATLHLGVYYMAQTNSNEGSLGVPIGQFYFSNVTMPCSPKTFDRWQVQPYLFYGPNFSPQQGPFANTSNSGKLDITTCLTSNGAILDTGILLQVNKLGLQPVGCSDDAGASCGIDSSSSSISVNLTSGLSYRFTIYFTSQTQDGLQSVTFHWYYHN